MIKRLVTIFASGKKINHQLLIGIFIKNFSRLLNKIMLNLDTVEFKCKILLICRICTSLGVDAKHTYIKSIKYKLNTKYVEI